MVEDLQSEQSRDLSSLCSQPSALGCTRTASPRPPPDGTRDFYSYFSSLLKNQGRRQAKAASKQEQTQAALDRAAADGLLAYVDNNFTPARADLLKVYLESKEPLENEAIIDKLLPTVQTQWVNQVLEARQQNQREEVAKLRASLDRKVEINASQR